jgi:Ca2+-binding EF-hand superfamily protein
MKKRHLTALGSLLITTNMIALAAEANGDLMQADTNHDGKVSFEEFKAAHEAAMLERFKSKDVNKDGFIDLEEKVVAQAKQKVEEQAKEEAEAKTSREKYEQERETRKKHFFKYK